MGKHRTPISIQLYLGKKNVLGQCSMRLLTWFFFVSAKRRSDVLQSCGTSVRGEVGGSQKSNNSSNNYNENYDANLLDDHQSEEGTTTTPTQSAQSSVRFPFENILESTPRLNTVTKDAASRMLELVHQKFAEIQATLSTAEAMFDELTEGEVIKALLQSPPLVRPSSDANDNELEDTADIGISRFNWTNSEGDADLREVTGHMVRVVSGSSSIKSEMGLVSDCHLS